VTVSGVDSVRVRVHLYERSIRPKPVSVFIADGNDAGTARDTSGALDDVTD
jgi:hypothetical protein